MTDIKHAVIYARVSSKAQVVRGEGLASQITRLIDYAQNYLKAEVVEIFKDDISGRLEDRPGMKAMLSYLRKHRKTPHFVCIDDVSRLARNIDTHRSLRKSIDGTGAVLSSPNIQFGDDADSEMSENLAAMFAHHMSRKNAEQTINRQNGCLLRGHWPFSEPVGYKRLKPGKGQTNILVPDEPIASIIKEALNGYADGRFRSQAEVAHFLEAQPEFPKDGRGKIRYQLVKDILTRVIYTGYIEHEARGIERRKGLHEGLITLATFRRIQQRLNEKAYAPTRVDLQADFPLRGAVVCGDCGSQLTASWSKSKSGKKHPYYMCFKKGCCSYRKSIRRDQIEGEFETLMQSVTPSKQTLNMATKMFKALWEQQSLSLKDRAATLKTELATIDRKMGHLLDRIVDTDSSTVIQAYETKIKKMEEDKMLIAEKLEADTAKPRSFNETVRTLLDYLQKPLVLWSTDQLEDKRSLLKLTFAEHLVYQRNEGFRTPKTTLPFKVLGGFVGAENNVAEG